MRLLWLLQKLQRWFLKSRGGTLELWIDRAKTEAYFSVMLDIIMRKSLQLGLFITRLDYQIHSNLNMSHNIYIYIIYIYIYTKFNSRLCEKTYFVMSSDDWLLKTQSFSPPCLLIGLGTQDLFLFSELRWLLLNRFCLLLIAHNAVFSLPVQLEEISFSIRVLPPFWGLLCMADAHVQHVQPWVHYGSASANFFFFLFPFVFSSSHKVQAMETM